MKGSRPPSARTQAEDAFALHIKARGLPEAQRQHKFHPDRKWVFDFAWPAGKVAVEVEGGVWRGRGRGSKTASNPGGAHSHPLNILRDMEKYNAAAALGWRVFRFTTDQVKRGDAVDFMARLFK